MKILITSGGTREYIDDVRVLTNISSGRLGAMVADRAVEAGHDVIYLHGIGSVMPHAAKDAAMRLMHGTSAVPATRGGIIVKVVKDTASLMTMMEKWVPEADAVVHSMAVSDFTFDRAAPVKLKSSDAEGFIEFMRQTIRKTPKVLKHIKGWNPDVFLISFKFEVGLERDELFEVAWESGRGALSDAVFANDKSEMDRRGEHVGYLLRVGQGDAGHINAQSQEVVGKEAIAKAILGAIESWGCP